MKSKIHINQLGYIKYMPKKAVYVGNGSSFEIIDAVSEKIMYVGTLSKNGNDKASGDIVSTADFSSFNLPGEYYIRIGRKRSDKFPISDRPYTDIKNALLKGFYYNRCGCVLDKNYVGEYTHNKCHTNSALLFGNSDVEVDVSGGWHDSGSYSKYVTTACAALGHMLYAYKLFPQSFADKNNIPHSQKDVPDILCECRVELEWLLKMQTRCGGVYHKVCTLEPSGFVVPEDDCEQQYVFPCSHQATACFIAVCALASGLYEKYDRDFADLLQSAAFNGWIWISNHPKFKPFFNPPAVNYSTTGDTADDNIDDDMFWAICELYSMTGEDIFRKKIVELYKSVCVTGFSACDVGGFGALSYIFSGKPKDIEVERYIRLQYRIEADNLSSLAEKSGYDTAKAPDDYKFCSNMSLMTNCMVLIYAYLLLKCEDYLCVAQEQLNYIFGKNPMGMCYVTGFGSMPVTQPHHRPSAFDEIDPPVPGLVVLGPNTEKNDDYARWNISNGTPPAKCYCDTGFCYSTNEVSIGCNSSTLFAVAFFDTLED